MPNNMFKSTKLNKYSNAAWSSPVRGDRWKIDGSLTSLDAASKRQIFLHVTWFMLTLLLLLWFDFIFFELPTSLGQKLAGCSLRVYSRFNYCLTTIGVPYVVWMCRCSNDEKEGYKTYNSSDSNSSYAYLQICRLLGRWTMWTVSSSTSWLKTCFQA